MSNPNPRPLSREVEIEPAHTAPLPADVQNCSSDGTEYANLDAVEQDSRCGYFGLRVEGRRVAQHDGFARGLPARSIYTVIESLTADGRDRSLDNKITGFSVAKGSPDTKVVAAPNEIVLPKTSSSVFISTNLDYVLRNLGSRYLIIAGCPTDQCVDSAVRDACDLGYLVTVPTDAYATLSTERHEWSLRKNRGYCRPITTVKLLEEIAQLPGA